MSGSPLVPDDPRHGTANGYINLGCRCDRCRAANTAYMKARGFGGYERDACPVCGGPKRPVSEFCLTCRHKSVAADHMEQSPGTRVAVAVTGAVLLVRPRSAHGGPRPVCRAPTDAEPSSMASNRRNPQKPPECQSCSMKRTWRERKAHAAA